MLLMLTCAAGSVFCSDGPGLVSIPLDVLCCGAVDVECGASCTNVGREVMEGLEDDDNDRR